MNVKLLRISHIKPSVYYRILHKTHYLKQYLFRLIIQTKTKYAVLLNYFIFTITYV
jgi:hypothetical protein